MTRVILRAGFHSQIHIMFWRYVIPTTAGMLASGLYQIIDGIFIGHFVGESGLAAINVIWPVISVVVGAGIMIGIGTGSLMSLYRGRSNASLTEASLNAGIIFLISVSVGLTLLLFLTCAYWVKIQNISPIIFKQAMEYGDVLTWAAGITLSATALPFWIRNDQKPHLATAIVTIGAIGNVIFDYLLIGVAGWGLTGAALATSGAQLIIVIICLLYFIKRTSQSTELSTLTVRHLLRYFAQISVLGGAPMILFIYSGLMVALHNYQFTRYGFDPDITAYAIISYLLALYYLIAQGIAEGIQPPMSEYHGRQQSSFVYALLKLGLCWSTGIGVMWVIVSNAFPNLIFYGFDAESSTVQLATLNGIHYHLWGVILDAIIILFILYFVATDQGRMAVFLSIINISAQIPCLFLMPIELGLKGVWLAMPLSKLPVLLLTLLTFMQAFRKQKVSDSVQQVS